MFLELLSHVHFLICINEGKKDLVKYFEIFGGRVSICFDIWSDHWQLYSYMCVTTHYIDND